MTPMFRAERPRRHTRILSSVLLGWLPLVLLLTGCGENISSRQDTMGRDTWNHNSPYLVRRAKGAVPIDGRLDEEVWSHAMVIREFFVPKSDGTAATKPTEVRMLWDDEALYVHFIAWDEDLRGTYTQPTDPIWQEDAVEIFLQPDPDATGYYEFEVNPINGMMALRIPHPQKGTFQERADWEYSVHSGVMVKGTVEQPEDTDEWFRVMLRIPFSDLEFAGRKAPQPGDRWRFQCARCNRSKQFGGKQELSACVPLPIVDFHINEYCPDLRFVE